jgi:osmotically-inducible protein OsmY
MKTTKYSLCLSILAASGLVSCHKNGPSENQARPAASTERVPATPFELTDASITTAVHHVLAHDPGVDANGLHVKTTDGVVELSGTAHNLLTKQRAVRVVEAVRGVRAVSDRTSLDPEKRSDSEILKNLKAALGSSALTDLHEVSAKVSSGVVTVMGSVHSYQERDAAGRLAEGIVGVRQVDNQVQVKPGASRSDSAVATDVVNRLRWDTLVNDGLIDVAVHDGRVALTGKVGSAAEKRRAAVDGWVLGAANVDDSGLHVDVQAAERDYLKHKLFVRSNTDVAQAIRDAAAYDPRVSAADLRVSVDNGRARLYGSVGSLGARLAAEDLARHTVGVMSVQNELMVKPIKAHADADVERAVKAALLSDPYTYSQTIDVKAHDGKVTLRGRVRSRYERAQATDVAAAIEGVKDIDNALTVEHDEIVYIYDAYLYPYGPLWAPWYAVPSATARSDSQIAESIHEELVWSPFVDADQVKVQVQGGHATLTGQVDSQHERIAATEDAYEGGAVAVDNRLTLAPGT